jgi:hypothetical protein
MVEHPGYSVCEIVSGYLNIRAHTPKYMHQFSVTLEIACESVEVPDGRDCWDARLTRSDIQHRPVSIEPARQTIDPKGASLASAATNLAGRVSLRPADP